jgi:glycosyltransferase involved in cell wall biosynthesis
MRLLKPVVLVVGDAVAPTGFARVTRSIISRLNHRYLISQLGINYLGDPHDESWRIFPAGLGGDLHGVKRIAELVATIRPDFVLIVNDVWVASLYVEALSSLRQRPKTVAYLPVDSEPVLLEHVRGLQSLDRIVAYNHFGARTLAAAADDLRAIDPTFQLPPIDIIPHGVDSTAFRPLFPLSGDFLQGRHAMRRTLLPHGQSVDDAFIVLNANRNQPRKRIDVTIAGFALFAANKPPNVRLYLHMGVTDCGWDVRELARRHGVADRLMMTHTGAGQPQLKLDHLNLVYNACDVGLNTADGEAWGLASFEHAATGAAQIVPGHSGPREIWEGAAEMLAPSMQITAPQSLGTSQLIAPQTVSAALERLYRDPALLLSRSLAAYRRATEPRYDWDRVADGFDRIFSELANVGQPRRADVTRGPTPPLRSFCAFPSGELP